MYGVLYLCPTPIGNLQDITIRTLKALKSVDLIAAEDTRRSTKLLNHYNIKNKITSYYEFNKNEKGKKFVDYMKSGKNIALVTDAGTPGISDPGQELVEACIQESIKVVSLPGACALITALVASGLGSGRFCFEGFLSIKNKNRMQHLNDVKNETKTLIFYEAPHKLLRTLIDMKEVLGNRKIVLAREITKKFEQFTHTTILDAIERLRKFAPKGEFALIIEGSNTKEEKNNEICFKEVKEKINEMLALGFSVKAIIAKILK